MRPLLIGPLVTAVFALTVAYFFWTGTVKSGTERGGSQQARRQRHMAKCHPA